MRRASRLVPVLSIGLSACGAAGPADTTPVVRDSAGITIIENVGPAWPEGEGWRIDATPLVDIGMLEGPPEYQLFRVNDAVRLSDGRIVVANAGTGELRYFDAAGRHLLTVGGQGGGPGEFESVGWIQPLEADSMLAYDTRLRRLSAFDPAGRFVGTRTIQSIAGTDVLSAFGRFGDGSFLLQLRFAVDPGSMSSGLWRPPSVLIRSDGTGAGSDSLGTYPGAEGMIFMGENTIDIMRGGLMHRLMLAVSGERFFVGTQDAHEVQVRPMTGEPGVRIRWSGPDLALTPEIIERYRKGRLARSESEEARRALRRRLGDMEFPETLPAYGEIVVDGGGNLWVERVRRPGEEGNQWHVFDPEGRLLGSVDLPIGLEVFQIGPDFVLGRWTDDLDVEHVRLHELTRKAASTSGTG